MNKQLAIPAILLLLAIPVQASYISMTMTLMVPQIVSENEFNINVTVVNSGDEPAHDVSLDLSLPDGFKHERVYLGVSHPNMENVVSFKVTADETVLPGTYPAIVKLHYADANSYPFSNVGPIFIRYKQPTAIKLRATIDAVNLSAAGGESPLTMKITNLDEKARQIKVKLHLPDELRTPEAEQTVTVGAKAIRSMTFPLETLGALAGSRYSVIATMEYEDDMHYGSYAQGMASIVDSVAPQETSLPSWLPMAALAVLVLAFVGYQFIGTKPKRGKVPDRVMTPPAEKKSEPAQSPSVDEEPDTDQQAMERASAKKKEKKTKGA